jgi:hypothetical protein
MLFDKTLIQNINDEIGRWLEQEKHNSYSNTLGIVEKLVDSLLKIIDQATWRIE